MSILGANMSIFGC